MDSTVSAVIGRVRDFRLEAALAASFTVVLAASAYAGGAAITGPLFEPKPAPAPVVEAAPAPEAPPKPKPLIAVGEPVPGGEINSPFGLRRLPWENHGRLHEGVDIAGDIGDPVLAAADGLVVRAGNSPTYGRHVVLKHAGGLTTLYAHLGRVDGRLKPGGWVEGGSAIGKVGSSGTSTGPHVHFEIRRKDRPLNPSVLMGREFATAEDLPLKEASRYSRRVRLAHVSYIPESKRALMAEKADKGKKAKAGSDSRPRATLQLASKPVIAVEEAPSVEAAASDSNAILPIPPAEATETMATAAVGAGD